MSRIVKLTLAGALALGSASCNEDALNPMADRQEKVLNYGHSEFYDDGMAMRTPPQGTVSRERVVGNQALATGRNGKELVTTFPITIGPKELKKGQKLYNITCGTCHGPTGDGDSIVGRHMALKPPPSLMLFADRPVGHLFEVATKGHGMMAAYEAELNTEERWAVVAYVRALQIARTAPLDKAPPAERQRLEKEAP